MCSGRDWWWLVVGDLIGSGASREQAVIGETPNLAARLQSIAEPNSIVLAESSRKLVGNLFELDDLGAQDLKGIAAHFTSGRGNCVVSRFVSNASTPIMARVCCPAVTMSGVWELHALAGAPMPLPVPAASVAGPPDWICPPLGVEPDAFNHDNGEFSAIAATAVCYNTISDMLSTSPEDFEPLFIRANGEVDAKPWCSGFYAAMKLRQLAWSKLQEAAGISRSLSVSQPRFLASLTSFLNLPVEQRPESAARGRGQHPSLWLPNLSHGHLHDATEVLVSQLVIVA
jgi:hypothetical protein